MAIQTAILSTAKLSDFDAAWAALETWFDPAWRCSANGPALPEKAWARTLVGAPDRAIMVAFEGRVGLGVCVYRPSDARILWNLPHPARYAEITGIFGHAIAAATGQRTWGYMDTDGPLAAVLAAGFAEVRTDKPQWPLGHVIWLTQ